MPSLSFLKTPSTIIQFLGRNIARFLLRESDREKENLPPPRIESLPGTAPCIFVRDDTLPTVLDDSFILPFIWKKNTTDSSGIPQGMTELLDDIRVLTKSPEWGLHFPASAGNVDLSRLPVKADSCWAPLVAALGVAKNGGYADPNVFSTGCWKKDQLVQVDHIGHKIIAIKKLVVFGQGPASKPVLFVPYDNALEARRFANDDIDIVPYPPQEETYDKILSEHYRRLHVPPLRNSSDLEERIVYANASYVRSHGDKRRDYYLTHLVHDLAERLRNEHVPDHCKKIRRLVLCLSHSFELSLLVLLSLQPEKAKIIVTTDEKNSPGTNKYFMAIKKFFHHIEPKELEMGREELCINDCVRWLSEVPPESQAVEITAGTKPMSTALIAVAQKSRAHVLYLNHRFQNTALCGDEEIRSIDWIHE